MVYTPPPEIGDSEVETRWKRNMEHPIRSFISISLIPYVEDQWVDPACTESEKD